MKRLPDYFKLPKRSVSFISGKRGVAEDFIAWSANIFITVLIIGILGALINGTVKSNLEIEDLKFYAFSERLLYSKDCFVKVENNRPYPGIIIASKFGQDYLDKCMAGMSQPIGAKITLHTGDKEADIYFNKQMYDDIAPLTFSNLYIKVKKRYYVLVENENQLVPGNLLIEVVWKK